VGFDFSVLSEFREWLIKDELLQKLMILIKPDLKKFAESPEGQPLEVVKWIWSCPQEG